MQSQKRHREANPGAYEKGLLRYEFLTAREFTAIFSILALVLIISIATLVFFVFASRSLEGPTDSYALQVIGFVCIFISAGLFIINLTFLSLYSER